MKVRHSMIKQFFVAVSLIFLTTAAQVSAQGAQVPFAGLERGKAQTVEMSADSLAIDQESHTAVFTGNVIAGIAELRLSADRVEVVYALEGGANTGAIRALQATGNVVFSSGEEAAKADSAIYNIEDGNVLMEGNVILTQGPNALSGERLRIDLNAGTALMEGRVQTIFQTGGE